MHFLLLKHFGQRYKNLTRILFQITLIQNSWQAKKQLVFARHNRTHRPTGAGIYWQHSNSRGNAFTASFHREVASPYWNSASHYWKKHSAFFLVPATSLDKNQQFGPKRPVGQAVTRSVSGAGAEASLKMVAPGRDFVVSPSIGQNIAEDQKKSLRWKTSWFSVRKYVMTKKKIFAYQFFWEAVLPGRNDTEMSPTNSLNGSGYTMSITKDLI